MTMKIFGSALLVGLALLGAADLRPAHAQGIAALVNEEPISNFDVAQRMRLMEVTGQRTTRQEILNVLIEEKLKFQEAKRLRIVVDEADVERIFASIAEKVKMTPQQLTAGLAQLGANAQTLRTRIRSDIAWKKVVQARLRGTVRVRESVVLSTLQERNGNGRGRVTEYRLAQVIFVTPRAGGVAGARRQEAESFRARFVSCEETLPRVRGLRDVVVKELGRKRSDEMPREMRELLQDVAQNKLTRPNVTANGVELVAVCEKREVSDDNAGERQIRDEMMSEELLAGARKLLTELRAKAIIEMR